MELPGAPPLRFPSSPPASPGKQSDGTLDRSLTFPSLPTPQDEAQGLAEGEDDSSRAYAAIDSGVLYRVGETARGVPTYVPRVVCFDLGGTTGGVRRAGHLYGDDDAAVGADGNIPPITSWDGGHRVFRQERAHKSAFLRNLEEDALVDALDGDDEEEVEEDASHAENDDPDRRMDTDDSEDEDEDDARRSKWGGSTKRSRNGGDVDAIAALRAKMTAQLRVGFADERRGRRRPGRDGRGEDANRRAAAALEDANRRAAALEASASTLADDARSWTDFCKACLHPRSSGILPGLWSGVDAFAGFGEGVDLYRSDERREEARDAVRYWAEECDALRGFQVFAEDLGGFGGVASAVTEEIRDEYGSVPTVLFSLRPPPPASDSSGPSAGTYRTRLGFLNDAMASAVLAPNCDAYVPVACPDASRVRNAGLRGYDGDGRYASSALKAAAIDTATLTWRARDDGRGGWCVGGTGMREVAAHLSARTGEPFAAMTATTPCEPVDVSSADDPRERRDASSGDSNGRGHSLLATRVRGAFDEATRSEDARRARAVLSRQVYYTPGCDDEDGLEPLAEVYSARGWRVRMRRDDASSAGDTTTAGDTTSAATPTQTRDALDAALAREARRAPRLRFASAAPLPLPLPFPRVFRRDRAQNPRECGAMTRLIATRSYGKVLTEMNARWRRAVRGGSGKATAASWGYGGADVDDIGESLASAAGSLLDGSDAGDDFEFDDADDE